MPVVNGANGAREKIKFDFGVTETVVLRYPTGKLVQGMYGEQFMFQTADDRVFYVDGDIARLIEECGHGGEPVSITRTKGPRGGIDWDVRRANAARSMPLRNGNGNGQHEPPSDIETRLRESLAYVEARKAAAAQEALEVPEPIAAMLTPKAKLLAALCIAIDCCIEAEVYAKRGKFPLEFSSEDVRTMANTIMINAEKSR